MYVELAGLSLGDLLLGTDHVQGGRVAVQRRAQGAGQDDAGDGRGAAGAGQLTRGSGGTAGYGGSAGSGRSAGYAGTAGPAGLAGLAGGTAERQHPVQPDTASRTLRQPR